jgi:hypothetical protein
MTELKGNYAFIDGQNLHRGTIAEGWIINYYKLRVYLEEKYNVMKAFYFIGYRKEDESLYKHLREEGYELVHKPTIIVDGEYKGNCDAELVLQCMIELIILIKLSSFQGMETFIAS